MYTLKKSIKINLDNFHKKFGYDSETGLFFYKKNGRKVPMKISSSGKYHIFKYGMNHIPAHRLAWFLETYDTPDIVYHKNGNKLDNRFENLEAQTFAEALRDTAKYRKPGAKGYEYRAAFREKPETYMAYVTIRGEKIKLGYYDTEEAAHNAYSAFIVDHS